MDISCLDAIVSGARVVVFVLMYMLYVDVRLDCETYSPCINDDLIEIMWLKIFFKILIIILLHLRITHLKPKYSPGQLIEELTLGIDTNTQFYPNFIIIIAGDFNQLNKTSTEVE